MTTCVCDRPLNGVHLCPTCTHALDKALADTAAHWTDLDNVRAGLVRYGGQGAGDKPPIDPRFDSLEWVFIEGHWYDRIPDGTALLDAVRNTITTWVRVALDHWPPMDGPLCHLPCLHLSCAYIRRSQPPADNIPACCRYLLRWTNHVPAQHWAPDILDELTHLAAQLRHLVDRPADRWYAGPCDQCERDLYARTGAAEVTCPECQLDYPVKARRDWLLEVARDQLVTAATLSRAVSWLGDQPLSADRIRQWARRGRITARPANGQGPMYRVGDALDLLDAERQRAG